MDLILPAPLLNSKSFSQYSQEGYRPGKELLLADTVPRAYDSSEPNQLYEQHDNYVMLLDYYPHHTGIASLKNTAVASVMMTHVKSILSLCHT